MRQAHRCLRQAVRRVAGGAGAAPAAAVVGGAGHHGPRLRSVVADHPVGTYLLVSFALTWAIVFPLALNWLPPEPGRIAVVLFASCSRPA